MRTKRLAEVCTTFKSNILINKIDGNSGDYPVFGAKGVVANVDYYQQAEPYISVIKWGAGVGRAELRPAFSSIVATMLGILPNRDIDIDWLCYLLQFMHLEQYTTNAVVPNLYFKDYCNKEIHVPDIREQRLRAGHLLKIQKIIDKRQKQLKIIDDLIKARFVEMFGDPKTNPFHYNKATLKETCVVVTGNTPSRAIPEYYGEYIEWIKTDNIVSGRLNPTTATEYLSEAGMRVGRTVDASSILMACIAGSIASIGKVCIADRKVAFNQQINAIIPKSYDILFLYVMLQISKDYLVEEINMALKGILSKSKLEEKAFILPPLEKQKKFASFVSQIDKSKSVIQKSLSETQHLFDSLMQEYFR